MRLYSQGSCVSPTSPKLRSEKGDESIFKDKLLRSCAGRTGLGAGVGVGVGGLGVGDGSLDVDAASRDVCLSNAL